MFKLIHKLDYRILGVVILASASFLGFSEAHDTNKVSALDPERPSERCLMSEGHFTCTDHSKCVQLDHVCDAIKDCSDHSDEKGKCGVKCPEGLCTGKCHPTPLGPYCLCPVGRVLSRDNVTCIDVNECDMWPPVCDQRCLNNDGSYSCRCVPGYELAEDQHHCYANPSQPGQAMLIYTQDNSIMMLHVGHGAASSNAVVVYQARGAIMSLALDTKEERVFWFSLDDHEVKAVGLSEDFRNNKVERVIKNGLLMVNTMAYDWVSKNLYIGDGLLHLIVICSAESHLCATMFTSNVLHVPRSLVLDPSEGKLYWSECGRSKKIESSSLDGTNTITLVREEVYCPNSLYIDQPINTLYWTDPNIHLLESVSAFDGTRRHKYSSKYITNPVQLAMFEEDMYIAYKDKSTEKILLAIANKYKYDSGHQPMLLHLTEIPADMQIYHKATQMAGVESPCSKNPCTGGLCVLTDRLSYRCLCPHGKRLDVSQHNCVWNMSMPSLLVANGYRLLRILPDSVGDVNHEILSLSTDHNISALAYDHATQTVYFSVTIVTSRARYTSLNSLRLNEASEVVRLFEGVGWITDIDIDYVSRNIYWSDTHKGVIEMARIDGTSRTVILSNEQVQEPNAVAVDPMQGKLYYSDCGPAPHVGVCDLDGSNCYIQSLGTNIKCVSDLFIDYSTNHLYWTDSIIGLISVTDLHQFSAVEIRHSPAPVSITGFGTDLYWLDSHYGDVLRQPKTDSYHDTRIKLGTKPLTDIVSLHPAIQPTGSNGCSGGTYGGCSHLCISKTRLQSVCMCPTGLQLSSNKKSCIQSNTGYTKLPKVKPVEDDIEKFDNTSPRQTMRPIPFNPSKSGGEVPTNKGGLNPSNNRPPVFPDLKPDSNPDTFSGPEEALNPYQGDETDVAPPKFYRCPTGLCVNAERCLYKHHQYTCKCNPGWRGKHCDVKSSHDDDDDDDDDVSALTEKKTNGGLTAGLVFLFLIIIMVAVGVLLVLRTHRRLRPGEVFSFMKLRYGVMRKSRDPKLETLINPSCTDIVDNIYTDVNDIIEHNQRKKIKPPSLTHSQSLDSIQSSCDKQRFP